MADQSNINRLVPPLASVTTFVRESLLCLTVLEKMKSSWYYKFVGLHALHI